MWPWLLSPQIAELVATEFFEQGDKERSELNIEPSVSTCCHFRVCTLFHYIYFLQYLNICYFTLGPDESWEERQDSQHAGVLHRCHMRAVIWGKFIHWNAVNSHSCEDMEWKELFIKTLYIFDFIWPHVKWNIFATVADLGWHVWALLSAVRRMSEKPAALEASRRGVWERPGQRSGVIQRTVGPSHAIPLTQSFGRSARRLKGRLTRFVCDYRFENNHSVWWSNRAIKLCSLTGTVLVRANKQWNKCCTPKNHNICPSVCAFVADIAYERAILCPSVARLTGSSEAFSFWNALNIQTLDFRCPSWGGLYFQKECLLNGEM